MRIVPDRREALIMRILEASYYAAIIPLMPAPGAWVQAVTGQAIVEPSLSRKYLSKPFITTEEAFRKLEWLLKVQLSATKV